MKIPPRKIVRDEDDGETFLTFEDSASRKAKPVTDIRLEELADFLDQDAESNNSHMFVGAHRALAVLLHDRVGRELATELMTELAGYSGLHGMVDDAGAADGYPTLLEHLKVP